MPVFRNPKSPENIVACPYCHSLTLGNIGRSTARNTNYNPVSDDALVKVWYETYPNYLIDSGNTLVCYPCLDSWRADNYYPEKDTYEGEPLKGIFPAELGYQVDIKKFKEPPVRERYCVGPNQPCNCGHCPDPNQLTFNLKGASKEELCGKTYGDSNYDPDFNLYPFPCCDRKITCTIPTGHDGAHVDESHFKKGCSNKIYEGEEDRSCHSWNDAINPWDEFLKEGSKDDEDDDKFEGRLGRCFQIAGRVAAFGNDPGANLIHGTIQNFGYEPLAHAWVEHSDDTYFEPTTNQVFPKEVFEGFFNPVVEKRYNRDELNKIIGETGHWGPWHETKGRI